MGTVLTFQPSLHNARSTAPGAEMGKLLLFTGIRYDRSGEDETAGQRSKGRRAKARRRT